MDIDIDHDAPADASHGTYVLHVDGRQVGELHYRDLEGRRSLDHVGVHPSHRGHGFAGHLTRRALDDARSDGVEVIPTCPFVAAYVDAHPDDQDLVHRPSP